MTDALRMYVCERAQELIRIQLRCNSSDWFQRSAIDSIPSTRIDRNMIYLRLDHGDYVFRFRVLALDAVNGIRNELEHQIQINFVRL